MRILAVTIEERLSGAPEIQTVIESSIPELRYAGWFGLFAPRATPGLIVHRIAEATCMAIADPKLQETYRFQDMELDSQGAGRSPKPMLRDRIAACVEHGYVSCRDRKSHDNQ